jgi:hypothetical protein
VARKLMLPLWTTWQNINSNDKSILKKIWNLSLCEDNKKQGNFFSCLSVIIGTVLRVQFVGYTFLWHYNI